MDGGNGDKPDLPPGWAWATLGELGTWTGGGTPSKSEPAFWSGGTIPWVSPKDMKFDFVGAGADKITEEAVAASAAKLVRQGSVLIVTRSGILKHTVPVAIAERDVTLNQDMRALTPCDGVLSRYVQFYVRSQNNRILQRCSKDGTTVSSIDFDRLAAFPVPLAPSAEQVRIGARITELFGEIEAGEQELEKAREGLETYRRAVLKAAVTGELTKDWRERNTPKETGADLLARILKERRVAWEKAQLARMKGNGRRPKDDAWKGRYEEPQGASLGSLPDLPSGWTWASLDQVAWQSSYGTSEKCNPEAGGVAVLRIPNVQHGEIALANLKYAGDSLELGPSDLVRPGDLLVVRTNGSEDLIGRGAVCFAKTSTDVYFASYLIRFRLVGIELLWRWLSLYWRSHIVRDLVRQHAATSAGQYNVSQSNLRGFPVPLPPEAELQQMVQRLEEQLNGARALQEALNDAFDVTRLRQSALSAAFAGRLMTQDSRDEPASALLERLVSTKAATPTKRKGRTTAAKSDHGAKIRREAL